jgi:AraC-like DNA-binding protein
LSHRGFKIKTVFCSDGLALMDRLAAFDEFQVNSLHPMRVTNKAPESFHAKARALDLAAVNVVELTCSTSDIRRTPSLIRESDPELYSIVLPLSGRLVVAQGDRGAMVGERDLALYSSSHPFHVRIAADGGSATLLRAHLHRSLLPLPAGKLDRLLALRLSGRDGVGRLLAQFLTGLTTNFAPYRSTDLARLSTVAIDLLTATLAHHLDADDAMPDDSHRSVLFLRIQAFVQQHLSDPELSPRSVAAAHHISVSYLHRLFQARDTTVSAWIRDQRLEHARRDLTDPALQSQPVRRIATRWGFNDHATFTRAFRAAYHVPPRDYRHHALGLPAARDD